MSSYADDPRSITDILASFGVTHSRSNDNGEHALWAPDGSLIGHYSAATCCDHLDEIERIARSRPAPITTPT